MPLRRPGAPGIESALRAGMRTNVALLLLAISALTACSTEVDESDPSEIAEDVEITQDELTSKAVCTVTNIQSGDCKILRYYLTSAAKGVRRTIVERGFRWVQEGVKYSASGTHTNQDGTYRRDCSGFVSMAWALGTSVSTRRLAPFSSEFSYKLPSYDALLPGDVVNRTKLRNGVGHTAVFAGWATRDHLEFYLLQELQTGSPAMLTKHARNDLLEYTPIRKRGL